MYNANVWRCQTSKQKSVVKYVCNRHNNMGIDNNETSAGNTSTNILNHVTDVAALLLADLVDLPFRAPLKV